MLALAEAEEATVVPGDQRLLELTDGFPIRSPRDFLEVLDPRTRGASISDR